MNDKPPSIQEWRDLYDAAIEFMASFEDREFLQKQDFQLIKKVGLKFSGPNSWPLFRGYLPGYHPWYLTKSRSSPKKG